jgi:peptidoglycan-associated lipoprotein
MLMKMRKLSVVFVAIVLAVVVSGCRHQTPVAKNNPVNTQPPAPSPLASLTASPTSVDRGQPVQLSWNTQNATSITIEGIGSVSASGSRTITPQSSTTYHLLAKGDGGDAEANARVTVSVPTTTTTTTQGPSDEQLFAQNVKDVFFSYDKYDIRTEDQQVVNADASFLAQHPKIAVLIQGHCDERGSDEYNMGLGENRAEEVKSSLVKQGVSADRIKIISYGKEKPFCTRSETEDCWQENRRAHFAFAGSNEQVANGSR